MAVDFNESPGSVLKDSRACAIFNDKSWPICLLNSYPLDSDIVGGQCYL